MKDMLKLPVAVIAVGLWGATVIAQEAKPAANGPSTNAVTAQSHSNQSSATSVSAGVSQILKMADAGVSTEVILAYVEASPVGPQPTDKDIIALKEHKVPDEVVKLLLKRSSVAREQAIQSKNEALLQIVESRRAVAGGVDPDSYDYFRAYHLQPRATAAANQRLYSSYGPYYPRAYNYGPVYTYGAPGRYGYPGYRGAFR